MKKKQEKIYRIYKSYSDFVVQEYKPQKTFLWIFITRSESWDSLYSSKSEQEAMAKLRACQKYDDPYVTWQSNVDELDLAEALE